MRRAAERWATSANDPHGFGSVETCTRCEWTERRHIVVHELATLNYLDEMLTTPHPDRPSMAGRVEVFHGSLDADERERIIREFNYNPRKTKVRVLLATDAASEGIDLHRACHRLVHMEVPFNPNRMEQRNGRIDRTARSPTRHIFHFASPSTRGRRARLRPLVPAAPRREGRRHPRRLGSVSSVLLSGSRLACFGRDQVSTLTLSSRRRDQPGSISRSSSSDSRRNRPGGATSTARVSKNST